MRTTIFAALGTVVSLILTMIATGGHAQCWVDNDLTSMATHGTAAAPGSGLAGDWGSDNSQHVNLVDGKGHVHELYIHPGASWVDNDLTSMATHGTAAAPGSGLAGDWGSDNSQHVNFIDGKGHVHELYIHPGASWVDNDLSAYGTNGARSALSRDWGSDNSQHVNFVDGKGHVHELYIHPGASWVDNDLTSNSVGGTAAAQGSAVDRYWGSDNSQHVNFIDGKGHVHELYIHPLSPNEFDVICVYHPDSKTTVWRIDQPNVRQAETMYPQIRFHSDDVVTISAGGCVQTGGVGKTWKSYINPLGNDADHLYSGTIYIPGAMPPGGNAYARIGGFLNKAIQIPENLSPPVQKDLFLHLGYQDEPNAYGDNGYYSHDDGNYDQCKGVGPAWVTVEIATPTSPSPPTPSGLPGLPPGAKPFDEAWDPDNEDVNGLPLDPFWAYQVRQLTQGASDPYYINPDFAQICGTAFSGGNSINTTVLSNVCTSQSPTADISGSDLRGFDGYCDGSPLSGHLEWFISTFTGHLNFDSSPFSGTFALEDDDLNFMLAPPGLNSLAAANGSSIGLELRADESIDNASSPFWSQVRNYAEHGNGPNNLNNKFAVVTGLLGIDGVHGGKAELHPVYSMAVQDSVSPAKDGGTDETWQIFLINSGVGGGCSNGYEHQWLGLSDGTSSMGWYFISLPMPSGATTAKVVSYNISDYGLGSYGNGGGFVERQFGNWVYLGFQLGFVQSPDGPVPESMDGSVTINYNVSGVQEMAQKKPVERPPAEEDVEWQDVLKKMNSATRQKIDQALRGIPPIRISPRSHTEHLSLVTNPSADKALALLTAARRRSPVRARAVPNLGLQSQIKKVEQTIALGTVHLKTIKGKQ